MGTADGRDDSSPMSHDPSMLTVTLFHDGDPPFLEYPAEVLFDDGDHVVVRAKWAEATDRDVGYVRFEKGDVWTEHYWRGRWYAVREVRDADGRLKGWYCDVTRLSKSCQNAFCLKTCSWTCWVSGECVTILLLDEDEFMASGLPVVTGMRRMWLDGPSMSSNPWPQTGLLLSPDETTRMVLDKSHDPRLGILATVGEGCHKSTASRSPTAFAESKSARGRRNR